LNYSKLLSRICNFIVTIIFALFIFGLITKKYLYQVELPLLGFLFFIDGWNILRFGGSLKQSGKRYLGVGSFVLLVSIIINFF
jgi:hypothetical protein